LARPLQPAQGMRGPRRLGHHQNPLPQDPFQFSDGLLTDLEGIVKSIAVHNPAAAVHLGELIIKTAERLSFFPERHPRVQQRPGVRRCIVKKHFKIFYRVLLQSKTVEVLRCWDGRRESVPFL
jgi:plasmid stabilization system protein ParE